MIAYVAKYRLGTQECYLVADVHVDTQGALMSKEQRQSLMNAIKQQAMACVVEDMWDYQGDDIDVQRLLPILKDFTQKGCLLFPNLDTTIIEYSGLSGFAAECRQQGIEVENGEFRHHYLVNTFYGAQRRTDEALMAFNRLLSSFKEVIMEIKSYHDAPTLQSYYADTAAEAEQAVAFLTDNANKVLAPEQMTLFLSTLWQCMINLLDARLIHQWYIK